MKRWNIGLIGCGGIAEFHVRAIDELPNARLTAVASRTPDKARALAEREGCEWASSHEELLAREDLELVIVATSSGSHAELGMDVLRAGKHLLVEKPMAMRAAEAARMIEEAERRGRTLAVISQRRYEPQHQAIKRLLDEGALGRLLMAEVSVPFYRDQAYYDSAPWRGTLAEDGGALMNQGIHSIDLLLWLAGPARSVIGKTATLAHRMEAEDIGSAIVTFESGALGTILASTAMKPGFAAGLALYGERGAVKLAGPDIVHWSVPDIPEPAADSSGHYGGTADPLSISHQYHRLQLADLLTELEQGGRPAVDGHAGRASVALIEGIYESARRGAEVALE
ncbi:Gfo/Idh/MocA family oxidoreductase [Paenibacillus sp. IB182496]|uniref:Gfo/Idh/MocA family oxidoreductase n=1 Tax=Paenibacillus sabuli TaxID=2772509 RepID=A0A927BPA8_9BACL|nr:Gfo/Idh/MocA family oxidoreductase [Paenibacillus sabuli]MBD2844242.1 Gfo/Idh/MocA family oxidoreductase [Paenibacillus sabuli]